MKKIFHFLFCYRNIPVTDAETGRKEIAQYRMLFGFPMKIKYRPTV